MVAAAFGRGQNTPLPVPAWEAAQAPGQGAPPAPRGQAQPAGPQPGARTGPPAAAAPGPAAVRLTEAEAVRLLAAYLQGRGSRVEVTAVALAPGGVQVRGVARLPGGMEPVALVLGQGYAEVQLAVRVGR